MSLETNNFAIEYMERAIANKKHQLIQEIEIFDNYQVKIDYVQSIINGLQQEISDLEKAVEKLKNAD